MDRRSFRKGKGAPDDILGIWSDLGLGAGKGRIRCPQCRWQPKKDDRWQCICNHLWHTFDTRGRCPMCSTQWHTMQCLRCARWSAHQDWYG